MSDPAFVLLYVDEPLASAAFYEGLLGRPPVEAAPTFVMFRLESGVMLGLWGRGGVTPTPGPSGGGELAFVVASPVDVDATHTDWAGRGIAIATQPEDRDFGRTFLALDPDGHRLRVFCPR